MRNNAPELVRRVVKEMMRWHGSAAATVTGTPSRKRRCRIAHGHAHRTELTIRAVYIQITV
eukprot:2960193-Prymnesium_polylepis.2